MHITMSDIFLMNVPAKIFNEPSYREALVDILKERRASVTHIMCEKLSGGFLIHITLAVCCDPQRVGCRGNSQQATAVI